MTFGGKDPEGLGALEARVEADADRSETAARQRRRCVERRRGLARDQTDDAADRLGTVQRRCRPLDYFDAFQSRRGLSIEVQDAPPLDTARTGDRLAVEQDQDLAGVDALNLLAGSARRFRSATRDDTGHFAQNLADGFVAAGLVDPASCNDVDARVKRIAQLLLPRCRHDGHLLEDWSRRECERQRL